MSGVKTYWSFCCFSWNIAMSTRSHVKEVIYFNYFVFSISLHMPSILASIAVHDFQSSEYVVREHSRVLWAWIKCTFVRQPMITFQCHNNIWHSRIWYLPWGVGSACKRNTRTIYRVRILLHRKNHWTKVHDGLLSGNHNDFIWLTILAICPRIIVSLLFPQTHISSFAPWISIYQLLFVFVIDFEVDYSQLLVSFG